MNEKLEEASAFAEATADKTADKLKEASLQNFRKICKGYERVFGGMVGAAIKPNKTEFRILTEILWKATGLALKNLTEEEAAAELLKTIKAMRAIEVKFRVPIITNNFPGSADMKKRLFREEIAWGKDEMKKLKTAPRSNSGQGGQDERLPDNEKTQTL
ncbi:MAG: hypothetical protein JW737_00300 [Acidobacteria bacterium]|nr:hypothetical protein [Acidobacteriota bacterium]